MSDSTIHCSFFRNATDNHARSWEGTWPQLVEILNRTFPPAGGAVGNEAKKSLPAISGTRFHGTRARANALELGLLLFDVDNSLEVPTGEFWPDPISGEPSKRPKLRKDRIPEPVTFDEIQEALLAAGVASCTWSTWSAKPDWPKFRVVIPLAHPVPATGWSQATERAITSLGFDTIRRGVDLPVLRDVARLNFLPGVPDSSTIVRGQTRGVHLAIPIKDLPRSVPALPEAAWQMGIKATRKARLGAGEHWWHRYQVGGRPVDFKALDLAALLDIRGYGVGLPQPHATGMKWRCHCPWAIEHSGGIDDDCAVVIQTPGQWPSFRCAHSSHAHLGLQDVIELLWGRP
ncbi:hypothetical protein [Holophaga foetida]|uniref:hypothetical protein n=1 Tax=Holophaga foetida TaxID=35839 RepID=UPI0002472F0D|nr:hypothetical protein [Holophaga foetida]